MDVERGSTKICNTNEERNRGRELNSKIRTLPFLL